MITRTGNKTSRTVCMENSVQHYFMKEYGLELESEVFVGSGRRADLACGYTKDSDKSIWEDVVIVEIKQAIADFYTGYGQNFIGISNYLAVPPELVGFAIEYLRNEGKSYVGVLEVSDNGLIREVIYPSYFTDSPFATYKNKMDRVIKYMIGPDHMRANAKA